MGKNETVNCDYPNPITQMLDEIQSLLESGDIETIIDTTKFISFFQWFNKLNTNKKLFIFQLIYEEIKDELGVH